MAAKHLDILDELLLSEIDARVADATAEFSQLAPLWAECESTLDRRPDDFELLHHLAVAYHSAAFSQELDEPGSAQELWRKAIQYWLQLYAAAPFWDQLEQEGAAMGDQFDGQTCQQLRAAIEPSLINVHESFALEYVKQRRYDVAQLHLSIIQESPFEPSLQADAIERLYEQFVGAEDVTERRAEEVSRGLQATQRFLELCPSFPRAVLHAVRCANRLNDILWAEMLAADRRAEKETLTRMKEIVCETRGPLEELERWLSQGDLPTDLDLMQAREAVAEQYHVWRLCDVDSETHDEVDQQRQLEYCLKSLQHDPHQPPRAMLLATTTALDLIESHQHRRDFDDLRTLFDQLNDGLPASPEAAVLLRLRSVLLPTADHHEASPLNVANVTNAEIRSRLVAITARQFLLQEEADKAWQFVESSTSESPQEGGNWFWFAKSLLEHGDAQRARDAWERFHQQTSGREYEVTAWLKERIDESLDDERALESIRRCMDQFERGGNSRKIHRELCAVAESGSKRTAIVYFGLASAMYRLGFIQDAHRFLDAFQELARPEEMEQAAWLVSEIRGY